MNMNQEYLKIILILKANSQTATSTYKCMHYRNSNSPVLFHLGSEAGTSLRIISLSLMAHMSPGVLTPPANELTGNNWEHKSTASAYNKRRIMEERG